MQFRRDNKVRTGKLPRIAMVAYTNYLTDPRCRREASLAAQGGWDVHFFGLSTDGQSRIRQLDGITQHELAMKRYRGDSSFRYILGYLHFLILASWSLQKHHMQNRFQVVHINTMPDFMVLSALLPRLFGAKVILDIHDVMPEIYMTKFRLPADNWKIRWIKKMEVFSAYLAHRVLTAEHPKGELLADHGIPKEKIHVLLNLPDDQLFVPQFTLPDEKLLRPVDEGDVDFRLIYHGTLAHRLGMDHAVRAVGLVRERIPRVSLRLFGDGDQLPELHAIAEGDGTGRNIWFSDGFLPIEEIIPFIKKAHLAVLPARHEISTDYMLPTKLLEYLAFGIPAIFTPTKTVRYYFGDKHPFFINDPSAEAVAEKIMWIRDNYQEASRLTAELQDSWFSRYRWMEHKLTYLALLEDLLQG